MSMERTILEHYMQMALDEAQLAAQAGEVPVGAVVVRDGQVVGRGRNAREAQGDPTAHAEVLALRDAAKTLGGWYLHSCWLICTMEPCPMCAGAALQARIAGIAYGAADQKAGCCGSVCDLTAPGLFPHKIEVAGGICAQDSVALLQDFFRQRRGARENRNVPHGTDTQI